jgi:secreted trypsin-like serine protease
VSTKNGHFTLAGIVSFGQDICGVQINDIDEIRNEKYYGIYTNVANYVDWIKQNSDYTGCYH